jgi:hypothetical protein
MRFVPLKSLDMSVIDEDAKARNNRLCGNIRTKMAKNTGFY